MIALIPCACQSPYVSCTLTTYSELLEEHEYAAQSESTEQTLVGNQHCNFGDSQAQTLLVRMLFSGRPLVKHDRCFDLEPLSLNDLAVDLQSMKLSNIDSCFFFSALGHEPARAEWKKERGTEQDDSGHTL
jgi:hypothetical protein